MSKKKPVIVWFRQDLRLRDNPALRAAHKTGHPIIPLYILDDTNSGEWKMGAASRWWLHQSLQSLSESLDGKLVLQKGAAEKALREIIEDSGAESVFWNRCYEPWRIKRDKEIKQSLKDDDIAVTSFNGSLLYEPQDTLKDDGHPYKVFTPFYKKGCLARNGQPRDPEQAPRDPDYADYKGLGIDALDLMPAIKWYESFETEWNPGEDGAHNKLDYFLEQGLQSYRKGRDHPAMRYVSRLSPHLHFGEISPNYVWHKARQVFMAEGWETDGEHFLSELGWREFSNNLLYHFPDLPRDNLQDKFDKFPWREDKKALAAWQKGMTGVPIVDAGMRELWQTGYMHNRVRMIVGSFLVKNLLLHWHHGEDWFWDTLVDADLANNSASWQWIAGCGADAAPYFRIFNPVTQGQKFDAEGEYVRKYVPEIANLPDKYLHCPWDAPDEVLGGAGVTLGKDYPKPLVDLKESRQRALDAFSAIKQTAD